MNLVDTVSNAIYIMLQDKIMKINLKKTIANHISQSAIKAKEVSLTDEELVKRSKSESADRYA